MEVVLDSTVVAAYMLGKRERQVAMRIWELNPEEGGFCETANVRKGANCKADGIILRPFPLPTSKNKSAMNLPPLPMNMVSHRRKFITIA
jgi:hypothetical protein